MQHKACANCIKNKTKYLQVEILTGFNMVLCWGGSHIVAQRCSLCNFDSFWDE